MTPFLLIHGETALITKSRSVRLLKFIKVFGYSSANSFIRAWYAPKRCLRSSETHVLTQHDLVLFFFWFPVTVAKMAPEAAMMIVRFLDIIKLCFVLLASPNRSQSHLDNLRDRPSMCTRRRFWPMESYTSMVWPMSQTYGQNISCIPGFTWKLQVWRWSDVCSRDVYCGFLGNLLLSCSTSSLQLCALCG